jgi:hypothetical protein
MVYDVPGLGGIELWRGIARGATLFALRERKQEYFEGLREFLVRLHRGEAAADDDRETEALRKAAGFARAVFCGGEAAHPLLEPILRAGALPFAIEIDTSGPYAARRGALEVSKTMGWRRAVALDLGQSHLKIMTAGGNSSVPRDTSLLPFGAHAIDAAIGRARLRSLIQEGLSRVETPDGIVLALPVALDRDGVAQPATYPGLFGPVEPIFSDLFNCPWVVLNDAVLAAIGFPPDARSDLVGRTPWSAADPRSACSHDRKTGPGGPVRTRASAPRCHPTNPREKTLVVTLGFGIGGALWER